jgi:transposase
VRKEKIGNNKYIHHSHISEKKFREILREFSRDSTVSETAERTKISRQTITKIYQLLRIRIFNLSEKNSKKVFGNIEVDESYFGAKRIRGKRGRGAGRKIPVFGLLKRNGRVYVEIVKNCSREHLMPIIKGKVLEGSTIYSDG